MRNLFLAMMSVLPLSTPTIAQSTSATDVGSIAAPLNGFCILNGSAEPHLFATETREGERRLVTLKPGARLCVAGTAAQDGIVSVFENADGFEGCSRIIQVGTTEALMKYAEFDRCGWSSHNS